LRNDLQKLIDHYRSFPTYKPVNPYAVIKLDKNFQLSQNLTYSVIQKLAQRSKYLQKMEVVSLYKDRLTIRFYYTASDHNLTEEEAKKELALVN
jgi:phenylalanyl-tRNA synthetase beta chain